MGFTSGGFLGTRVQRPTGACPQNVWQDIFTVAGGLILMTILIGERTVDQAGGGSNLDMQVTATVGGAVSLSAVTAVGGDAVRTLYTFTGNPGDVCFGGFAVPGGLAGGLLVTGINSYGWVIPPGTIEWRESAAGGTGSIQWTMYYIPIDDGVTVVAA